MAKKSELKKPEAKVKLTDLTVPELLAKASQINKDLNKKKLELTMRKLRNVKEVLFLRKELARVKTQINVKMKLNSVKL